MMLGNGIINSFFIVLLCGFVDDFCNGRINEVPWDNENY